MPHVIYVWPVGGGRVELCGRRWLLSKLKLVLKSKTTTITTTTTTTITTITLFYFGEKYVYLKKITFLVWIRILNRFIENDDDDDEKY
ncbi:hypothetical protein M0802_010476 [Mischocyttarus mexicanus]|nr:hypothetical protein M0802_010476 [Mischocyttarus mexicanus]